MQPYQEATEEIRNRRENIKAIPVMAARTAATLYGGGALVKGGSSILNRIIPLINKFVPNEVTRKGLAKIDPRIGSFVEGAINNGFDMDQIKNYLNEKFSVSSPGEEVSTEQETQNVKTPHNPLQEFENNYSDIAQALARTMQQGQSPQAAAGILKTSTAFGKQIKKLEKDVGKNFVDYVVELFGNQGQGLQQQAMQPEQMQQPQMQQMQPQQGQMQQGQAQGSGIDQQIMAALDKILKM